MSSETTCERCGAPFEGSACRACGAERAPERGRRAVVVGAAAIVGAVAALTGWQLVRGGAVGADEKPTSWDQEWLSGFSGLDRAAREQKETSRPVLVYFYTDW